MRILRGPSEDLFSPPDVGINIAQIVPHFISLDVTNFMTLGCGTCAPAYYATTTYQVAEDVDLIRGAHQISSGNELYPPAAQCDGQQCVERAVHVQWLEHRTQPVGLSPCARERLYAVESAAAERSPELFQSVCAGLLAREPPPHRERRLALGAVLSAVGPLRARQPLRALRFPGEQAEHNLPQRPGRRDLPWPSRPAPLEHFPAHC